MPVFSSLARWSFLRGATFASHQLHGFTARCSSKTEQIIHTYTAAFGCNRADVFSPYHFCCIVVYCCCMYCCAFPLFHRVTTYFVLSHSSVHHSAGAPLASRGIMGLCSLSDSLARIPFVQCALSLLFHPVSLRFLFSGPVLLLNTSDCGTS